MESKNIKIKEQFDFLYLNEKRLTLSQKDYINSLKKYFIRNKKLSENQLKVLNEIVKYTNVSDQQIRVSMSVQ